MAANIFQDPTKALPKKDSQIIRVEFDVQQLGGRPSHLPGNPKSADLAIQHIPNAGSKT